MSIQWALVFFLLLVGWGCGVYTVSVITTDWLGQTKQIRMISMITSLVLLALGGFTSVLHLTHPSRIFLALSNPTSGIFMEASFIGITAIIIIIYMVALKRNAADRTLKIIGTIGMIPAVILAYAIGNSYTLASRPAWDTILLPLNYFVSAAVMGFATVAILAAREKELDTNAVSFLNRGTVIAIATQAVFLIAYLIYLGVAPYPDSSRSPSRVLSGDLAALFWVGIVVVGLLVPAILLIQLKKKMAEIQVVLTRIGISLICIIIGSVSLRALVFTIGSSIKQYFS